MEEKTADRLEKDQKNQAKRGILHDSRKRCGKDMAKEPVRPTTENIYRQDSTKRAPLNQPEKISDNLNSWTYLA